MTKPLESPLVPLAVRVDLANAALAYANALVLVEIERDTGTPDDLDNAEEMRKDSFELLMDLVCEASESIVLGD